MCAAAAPGLLAGRKKQQQILELFEIALGQSAADALTGTAAVAAAAAAAGSSSASISAASSAGSSTSAAGPAGSPAAGLGFGGSGDVELELAVSCWWRAAALQALSAYVLGVMGKGFAEDPAQQVRGAPRNISDSFVSHAACSEFYICLTSMMQHDGTYCIACFLLFMYAESYIA
jgi:hypothetical protein